jgi:hypothetical protein
VTERVHEFLKSKAKLGGFMVPVESGVDEFLGDCTP